MPAKDPINWMLSDAIETLARAERLQRLGGIREGK
jgi:HSP20 family protein